MADDEDPLAPVLARQRVDDVAQAQDHVAPALAAGRAEVELADMAALLDSDEAISEYLSQVLADGDNEEFLHAIGYVVKARGMTQIAKDSGMGRESLYKAFAPGAKPRFDTVLKVIHALGIDLCAQPGHTVNHSNP